MRTLSILFFSVLLLACNEKGQINSFNQQEKLNTKTQDFLAFELCSLFGFVASVLDKYYWANSRGERVMYGSQFGIPCIENKDETNKLRKEIGLDPLDDDEFKICD